MSSNPLEVSLLGVLSILVITVNSCVCLLVYTNKKLRTYTNGFVVSLAVSDLLTGLTQFCIYLLRQKVRLFFNITYALSFFGGITTLCGVTWDRYVAVMEPLKYNNIVPKYFKVVISAGWSFTIVIAVMPLTWVLLDGNVNLHLVIHKIYQFLTVILGIVVPYIVIVWVQFRIYQKAKKCMRKDLKLENSWNRQRRMLRRLFLEAKVARIFIIVAIMFFISWFPITFYTLAFALDQSQVVPAVLIYDVAPAFIALRSLVNPIIYSLMKTDFRDALKNLMKIRRISDRSYSHRVSIQESQATASVRLSNASNASLLLRNRLCSTQGMVMESSL